MNRRPGFVIKNKEILRRGVSSNFFTPVLFLGRKKDRFKGKKIGMIFAITSGRMKL
jgi:hypothetical protein